MPSPPQIGGEAARKMTVIAKGGRPIIEAAPRAWSLEELLANMTPHAMGAAFSWGEDWGREDIRD